MFLVWGKDISKYLFTRVFILYLAAFFVFWGVLDQKKAKKKILNYLALPINYLVLFADQQEAFDAKKLSDYAAFYETYIDNVPGALDAYAALGVCYYFLGKTKKAIEVFSKAINSNPPCFWFYYNLGAIYFNLGDYTRASALFKKAVIMDPAGTFYFLRSSRIFTLIESPQLTDSYHPYIKPVSLEQIGSKMQTGYQKAYEALMKSAYFLNDGPAALEYAVKSLELNPGDPAVYFYSGILTYQLGRVSDAAQFFKESLKNDPRNPETFYYLGLCFNRLKQNDVAKKFFEEAVLLGKKDRQELGFTKEPMRLVVF